MRKSKLTILALSLLACGTGLAILQAPHEEIKDPLNKAWAQFDARNYQKCVEYGKLASKNDPANPEPDFIMGRCEERLGNFEASYQHFMRVCEIDPEYQDAYNNRAIQSMKLFNKKRLEVDLNHWEQKFQEDTRITQIRNQFKLVLEEQKKSGYSDEEARQNIKMGYLRSLMSIK